MTTSIPIPLMTAAERAGFRTAILFFRVEAARIRRAARPLPAPPRGPADALQTQQRNHILELCAQGIDLVADQAEAELPTRLH